jgi:hypothetical protein
MPRILLVLDGTTRAPERVAWDMSNTPLVPNRAFCLLAMGALIAAGGCAARNADRRSDVDRGGMAGNADRSAPAYDSVRRSESNFESERRTGSGFESERRSESTYDARSSAGISVRQAPPALRNDDMGSRPSLHHHWIAGYWQPQGGDWVWVPGRWERPPQGANEWSPSRIEERGSERIFYEGYWR